jgi:hypothetical protein
MLDGLAKVYNNPKLLTHLHQRPFLVSLLIHSVYLGEVNKVKDLYDQMSPEDQTVIIEAFKNTKQNEYLSPEFFPINHIYDASSEHPLISIIADRLIHKALQRGSLKDVYRFEKQSPGGLLKASYWLDVIKPTRIQIEEFYAWVNEQELQNLNSKEFDHLLNILFKHITKSGWSDLWEKAPPFLLDRLMNIMCSYAATAAKSLH